MLEGQAESHIFGVVDLEALGPAAAVDHFVKSRVRRQIEAGS